ncbi:MAG: hypothetical protein SVY53_05415 [Chloroflexota bacterium]|nr:hypothetical protein [Chloroflexota bacterium]
MQKEKVITAGGNMNKGDMVLFETDDWIAIYVDDKLITEGHEIEPITLAKLVIKHNTDVIYSLYLEEDHPFIENGMVFQSNIWDNGITMKEIEEDGDIIILREVV